VRTRITCLSRMCSSAVHPSIMCLSIVYRLHCAPLTMCLYTVRPHSVPLHTVSLHNLSSSNYLCTLHKVSPLLLVRKLVSQLPMVYYLGTTIEKIGSWPWHPPRFLNQRHSHTNRTRGGRDFGARQIGDMQIMEHQQSSPDFNDGVEKELSGTCHNTGSLTIL
jgi:hypothetical protein